MAKLNQILAVEKGAKAALNRAVTDAYHRIQNSTPLAGVVRSYKPRADDGDELPSESTKVQYTVGDQLVALRDAMVRLIDVTAAKDETNTSARADVVVDGDVLLPAVPAVTLLFLEKQLGDVRTFVSKLPVLDPAETWRHDAARGAWVTEPYVTTRTRKVPQNHVLAPATDKHPAQVQVFTVDEIVGDWTTIKLSGALPADRKAELMDRVGALIEAVKFAREEANMEQVRNVDIGDALFAYLLA